MADLQNAPLYAPSPEGRAYNLLEWVGKGGQPATKHFSDISPDPNVVEALIKSAFDDSFNRFSPEQLQSARELLKGVFKDYVAMRNEERKRGQEQVDTPTPEPTPTPAPTPTHAPIPAPTLAPIPAPVSTLAPTLVLAPTSALTPKPAPALTHKPTRPLPANGTPAASTLAPKVTVTPIDPNGTIAPNGGKDYKYSGMLTFSLEEVLSGGTLLSGDSKETITNAIVEYSNQKALGTLQANEGSTLLITPKNNGGHLQNIQVYFVGSLEAARSIIRPMDFINLDEVQSKPYQFIASSGNGDQLFTILIPRADVDKMLTKKHSHSIPVGDIGFFEPPRIPSSTTTNNGVSKPPRR